MALSIEKPFWRSGQAANIAGITADLIAQWRMHEGLAIGTWQGSEWRFSALDVAELATIPALRSLGVGVAEAIMIARHQLRGNLKYLLNNRLHHGFWSVGGFVIDDGSGTVSRVLFLGAVTDRVIAGLELFAGEPGAARQGITRDGSAA